MALDQRLLIRAVDITSIDGVVFMIPRYRKNYTAYNIICSDDCGIRRRTILYSRYLAFIHKTIIKLYAYIIYI